MIKRLYHWTIDYLHVVHKQSQAFFFKNPPHHYLGHIVYYKQPIILIPGVYEKWHFLRAIADPLSHQGHPVYTLPHLGYNTKEIPHTATLVRELIQEKDLKDVIIISHSKGGLVGKYILAHENQDKRVKKVITVATPFGGSEAVKRLRYTFLKPIQEFHPQSEIIAHLHKQSEVNKQITSIFGVFDNHVWPTSSCRLEGAKNIEVNTHGHHKILFDKQVVDIISKEVAHTI